MRVLNTRAGDDAGELAQLLAMGGHHSFDAPLAVPVAIPPQWPNTQPQAVIFTSRRAPAYCPPTLHPVPVCAIGARTAHAAQAAGFQTLYAHAHGDYDRLCSLLCAMPFHQFWHIGGTHIRHNIATDLAPHAKHVAHIAVYSMHDAPPWSDDTYTKLKTRQIDQVLLFSPAMAERFCAHLAALDCLEACRTWLPVSTISAAAAAPLLPWAHLSIASQPSLAGLLACAGLLCEKAQEYLESNADDL